jgi:hypothetical protein
MKQLMLTLVFAAMLGGCIVDNGSGGNGGYSSNPYGCAAYTTCGSCTPIQGCGWCSVGAAGWCVSDPDQCAGAPAFEWTWVQSGCPGDTDGGGGGDGGTAPSDAATDGGAAD